MGQPAKSAGPTLVTQKTEERHYQHKHQQGQRVVAAVHVRFDVQAGVKPDLRAWFKKWLFGVALDNLIFEGYAYGYTSGDPKKCCPV